MVHSCTVKRDRQTPLRKLGSFCVFSPFVRINQRRWTSSWYGSLRPGHVDVDPSRYFIFFETLEEGRSSVTRGKQADGQDDDEGYVRAKSIVGLPCWITTEQAEDIEASE